MTYYWLGTHCEHDLLSPRTTQSHEDVILRHVLDALLIVVLGVVSEDDALDLVRRPAQPALVKVVQDRLELRLRAGYVGHVADGHAQRAAEEPADMGRRVGELVRLVVAAFDGDEDAQVVLAGHHLDGRTRELGRDLVEAPSAQALLRAADIEGADGRVVRGLLGQVRDAHGLGRVRGHLRDGDGRGRVGAARPEAL